MEKHLMSLCFDEMTSLTQSFGSLESTTCRFGDGEAHPRPHLLLVFAQLSPHLSGLLGYLGDGDAGVLRLDSLSAGVEPKHVGAHRPLGTAAVL